MVVDLVRGEKEKEKKEKKESERRERESHQMSEGRRRTPLSDAFPGMACILTWLDATTNNLAQLITHLDLEATPGTPTPAKGPIIPHKEWEDSPTGKSKTLRPSMGYVISLRPYAQLRALTNAASRHDWMVDSQHVSASCVPACTLRGDVPAPPHDDAVPEPEPAPIFQPLHLCSSCIRLPITTITSGCGGGAPCTGAATRLQASSRAQQIVTLLHGSVHGMPLTREMRRVLGMCGSGAELNVSDPDSDIPDEPQVLLTALCRQLPVDDKLSFAARPRRTAPSYRCRYEDVLRLHRELKKLNDSGALDRCSFVKQLENTFKTPAKIDLRNLLFINVPPPMPNIPVDFKQTAAWNSSASSSQQSSSAGYSVPQSLSPLVDIQQPTMMMCYILSQNEDDQPGGAPEPENDPDNRNRTGVKKSAFLASTTAQKATGGRPEIRGSTRGGPEMNRKTGNGPEVRGTTGGGPEVDRRWTGSGPEGRSNEEEDIQGY
ncbi:hypothetical protein B0H10DRAFT_1958501 [Mycena sp. CBHHK59/15]|nr:hypothetical protein B0H10DRAFT_1958501 [Mycena sp. CBHHK59/15]